MSHSEHAEIDHAVLDLIDHNPTGTVPRTPSYMDALKRLHDSGQVYDNADHKDGHVTARSLAKRPLFHANNLSELIAGRIEPDALENNQSIFDRYKQSLPAALQSKAEAFRTHVAGKPIHHRVKAGHEGHKDALNTLFLVPGAGPQPALPGNYLHGGLSEHHDAAHPLPWCLHINDSSNNAALFDAATLAEALAKLQELLESAPFYLNELEAFGLRLN